MIDKEIIIDFFRDLKEANDFNPDEKLLWSYFFLDTNETVLIDFSTKLVQLGYQFINIFEAEKVSEEDELEYYLQVSKIENHTIDSLNNLNIMFYNLAKANNIDSYDGFDVGDIMIKENDINAD